MAATVTITDLAKTMFLAFATNTTVVSLLQSFRLKSIEMWSICDQTVFQPTTVTVQFLSTLTVSGLSPVCNKEYTDVSMGTARPAYIRAPPPRNTAHAFWSSVQGSGNTSAIYLEGQAGTLVDIVFDGQFNNGDETLTAPGALTVSSPTPVPGKIYFGFWNSNAQPQGVERIS